MALIPTERSLCNKIVADFYPLISPISLAKSRVRSLARDFENDLRSTLFSSTSVLDSAINSFEDDLEDSLPGDSLSDVQALKNFLENCEYLGVLSDIAALSGETLGAFEKIDELIDGLSSTVPEFGLGGIANNINKILNGLTFPFGDQISELLSKADKLIECLAAYCGGEYPAQVIEFTTTTNQLYDDLNIVSNPSSPNYGKFDYEDVYTRVGLNTSEIGKVTSVIDTLDTGNTTATSAIDSAIEAVKNVTRAGGIGGV